MKDRVYVIMCISIYIYTYIYIYILDLCNINSPTIKISSIIIFVINMIIYHTFFNSRSLLRYSFSKGCNTFTTLHALHSADKKMKALN